MLSNNNDVDPSALASKKIKLTTLEEKFEALKMQLAAKISKNCSTRSEGSRKCAKNYST